MQSAADISDFCRGVRGFFNARARARVEKKKKRHSLSGVFLLCGRLRQERENHEVMNIGSRNEVLKVCIYILRGILVLLYSCYSSCNIHNLKDNSPRNYLWLIIL